MAYLILFLCFAQSVAFASLQKLNIKNLDLIYVYPHGSGTFEKLQLGIKNRVDPVFPVEVTRGESSFDLTTPFVDFSWVNPVKFVHDLAAFEVAKLDLLLDQKEHIVKAEKIKFTPDKMGEFSLESVTLNCSGTSVLERVEHRLIEDCQNSLQTKVEKVNVPINLKSLDLPQAFEEMDIPGSDFSLNVKEGNFDLGVRIKYYLSARISAWGHLKIDTENKFAIIRVDKIKYGYLPITKIVMDKLQDLQSPNLEVNPPYIKIKLGKE